jgi:hypothetical protein
MSRRAILGLLPLILCVTPAAAVDISCDDPMNRDTSLADIQTLYGVGNVVTGEVPGAEGETMIATTVFPDDDEHSFVIYWSDEAKREKLSAITVAKADTAPGGVRVGMTINEVQALNGEPFTLWGFYWDYGGAARFDAGKLADLPGGCMLSVQFTPSLDPGSDAIADAVSGDVELRSDMKELAAVAPVVSDITIAYPDPDAPAFDDEDDPMAD